MPSDRGNSIDSSGFVQSHSIFPQLLFRSNRLVDKAFLQVSQQRKFRLQACHGLFPLVVLLRLLNQQPCEAVNLDSA